MTDEYNSKIYDSIGNIINPSLKRVVDKQLIFGPQYSYTYTTTMLPRKSTFYYRGLVDLAGNLTGLITGANAKKTRKKKFSKYHLVNMQKWNMTSVFITNFQKNHQ